MLLWNRGYQYRLLLGPIALWIRVWTLITVRIAVVLWQIASREVRKERAMLPRLGETRTEVLATRAGMHRHPVWGITSPLVGHGVRHVRWCILLELRGVGQGS